MRNQSISVHFARAVLKNTVKVGLDPAEILRRNRISPRLLQEENARISIERFADLQVSTMRDMDDESLGYASRRLPLGCWSMMCYALIGSDTLGQALHRYCRFYQMFDLELEPELDVSQDRATLRLRQQRQSATIEPYMAELFLFNAHRLASWLVQEHLSIQTVHLSYAMATAASDYRHMFLGHPVAFNQDECAVVMPSALLDKSIVQNEQSLRHFLRHPALLMLTQNYARSSWTSKVKTLLLRNMLSMPELPEVAAQLELHPQTLRRRLSGEGTTFKELKNQLRRDTALHYLGKQGLSIEEIAHRAGFSESSAFIRAFKSWTGVTPYSYRKGI